MASPKENVSPPDIPLGKKKGGKKTSFPSATLCHNKRRRKKISFLRLTPLKKGKKNLPFHWQFSLVCHLLWQAGQKLSHCYSSKIQSQKKKMSAYVTTFVVRLWSWVTPSTSPLPPFRWCETATDGFNSRLLHRFIHLRLQSAKSHAESVCAQSQRETSWSSIEQQARSDGEPGKTPQWEEILSRL